MTSLSEPASPILLPFPKLKRSSQQKLPDLIHKLFVDLFHTHQELVKEVISLRHALAVGKQVPRPRGAVPLFKAF